MIADTVCIYVYIQYVYILACVQVTIDGVYIGNWIY
jgi:hypothetical protein